MGELLKEEKITRRAFLNGTLISSLSIILTSYLQSCSSRRFTKMPNRPINPKKISNVLILGSGITGLCAGAILSKLRYKVTVLEAHPLLLGGHARTTEINGLKFCFGPQYVWNFKDNDNPIGTRVLNFLNIKNQNPFKCLNRDGFERFYIGSEKGLDIPMGLERFKSLLITKFPEENDNIVNFFQDIDILFKSAQYLHDRGLYLENAKSMIFALAFSTAISIKEKFRLYKIYKKSLDELFNRYNFSDKCRRILYGHCGIFAENSSSVSVGVYAAATGYYHSGATYPIYGFDQLINSLAQVINDNFGTVLSNRRVIKIVAEKKHIKYIKCSDDSYFNTDLVISAPSPRNTCKLIDGCDINKFNYDPSNSLTTCFIGIKNYSKLSELRGRNFWWQDFPKKVDFDNPNMLNEPTLLFASSSTMNSLSNSHDEDKLDALTVFAPGNFKQSKKAFELGKSSYSEFKKKVSEKIISKLNEVFFPEIINNIEFIEVYSPWDIFTELGSELGNVYGRKPDVENALDRVRSLDYLDNLQVACATVGQPGIATAFQTAAVLVERLTSIKI